MSIVRFSFFLLAVVVMASLLGNAASLGLATVAAALLFLPLLLLKIGLIAMLFGFFGRASGWGRRRHWTAGPGASRRPSSEPAGSAEARFDEWHRMAHAREEVDSWTPEM